MHKVAVLPVLLILKDNGQNYCYSYHDSQAEYKAGDAALPSVWVVSVKFREETLVR
jgi:hypothetical protein